MKERIFETIVGVIVLICTICFFIYSYNRSTWKEVNGYRICASFDNADGISKGSLVKISGVKVGIVSDIIVDKTTYLAKIFMTIDAAMSLPKDTEAIISSEGLLGGKYIALAPGFETDRLEENDEITQTRGSQNLESLINKFLMSSGENDKNSSDSKK